MDERLAASKGSRLDTRPFSARDDAAIVEDRLGGPVAIGATIRGILPGFLMVGPRGGR
jgi:hypothetical protein